MIFLHITKICFTLLVSSLLQSVAEYMQHALAKITNFACDKEILKIPNLPSYVIDRDKTSFTMKLPAFWNVYSRTVAQRVGTTRYQSLWSEDGFKNFIQIFTYDRYILREFLYIELLSRLVYKIKQGFTDSYGWIFNFLYVHSFSAVLLANNF